MRSHYKKLGLYIRKVDNRNKDLSVTNLKGLSMTKEFRESTSNIVGTDMSKYKIVSQWQFACDFMSTIRVFKLPVVLNKESEPVLVSPAYTVFESKNPEELLPEYLMMWFRRPEFDRYAFFKCDSAIRGGFGWEELCDVELPIPTPEKQREIVAEYNTIINRIQLNEQLCRTLEETAQALYKHWFVDFEFPMPEEYAQSIGKPELAGQPYKSSGGEMVFNKELEQKIPIMWGNSQLKEFGRVVTGKTPSSNTPKHFGHDMPFVTPTDYKNYKRFVIGSERALSQDGIKSLINKVLPEESLLITCIGSDMGKVVLTRVPCLTNQQINSIIPENKYYCDYLYSLLKGMYSDLRNRAIGSSTMLMINKTEFELIQALHPKEDIIYQFHQLLEPLNKIMWYQERSAKLLDKMKETLLSSLALKSDKVLNEVY